MAEVDEVYGKRAEHMIEDEYRRAAERWTFAHDLTHTEEEWEALILKYTLEHRWKEVSALARRALEMRIARPIEA